MYTQCTLSRRKQNARSQMVNYDLSLVTFKLDFHESLRQTYGKMEMGSLFRIYSNRLFPSIPWLYALSSPICQIEWAIYHFTCSNQTVCVNKIEGKFSGILICKRNIETNANGVEISRNAYIIFTIVFLGQGFGMMAADDETDNIITKCI